MTWLWGERAECSRNKSEQRHVPVALYLEPRWLQHDRWKSSQRHLKPYFQQVQWYRLGFCSSKFILYFRYVKIHHFKRNIFNIWNQNQEKKKESDSSGIQFKGFFCMDWICWDLDTIPLTSCCSSLCCEHGYSSSLRGLKLGVPTLKSHCQFKMHECSLWTVNPRKGALFSEDVVCLFQVF